jgi:hypothetical protein
MSMVESVEFVREDLEKPENRVNLALFGCLCIEAFRDRVLEYLDLSRAAVLRRRSFDGTSERPDFEVIMAQKPAAVIEVELGGRNEDQLRRYGRHWGRVISIVGKDTDISANDKSLEQIKHIAEEVSTKLEGQPEANLKHLIETITVGLDRVTVQRAIERVLPEWFLEHPGLAVFEGLLNEPKFIENRSPTQGGVSLRLMRYGRQDVDAGRGGFALISARSRDLDNILVPTREELQRRLRGRHKDWGTRFADLIDQLAVPPRHPMRNNREAVPVQAFNNHAAEVRRLFEELPKVIG